jgi:hypothetical protein
VLGKGDAMWRALSVLEGELVCFLDADSERFGAHYVCGLLGPLLSVPGITFVKGFYRRPLRIGDATLPDGGGRVTELTARPLLAAFYPDLTGFEQPLAGEIAVRRELLERLPFVTGYGVDIALLLDAYAAQAPTPSDSRPILTPSSPPRVPRLRRRRERVRPPSAIPMLTHPRWPRSGGSSRSSSRSRRS